MSTHAQLLRSNVVAVHSTQPLLTRDNGAHPVLLRTARSLGDAALLADAIHFTRELSEEADRYLGPDHIDTLTIRSQMAQWLGDAGDLAESVPTLERLVAGALQVLGPDHPSTLDARRNLAYQRGMAGDPARAVTEFSGVLADRSRMLGPYHRMTLTCVPPNSCDLEILAG